MLGRCQKLKVGESVVPLVAVAVVDVMARGSGASIYLTSEGVFGVFMIVCIVFSVLALACLSTF